MRTARARFSAVLSLGVCAAFLAGIGHFAEIWLAARFWGKFSWVSRDFFWMAPISYGLLLVPAALGLALGAPFVRSRSWFAGAAAVLACAVIFGLLLPYSQISRTASLILSMGVGFQIGRWCRSAPERWARTSARLAFVAVAVVAAAALVQPSVRAWRESRAVAALPPAATGAPNVILVVLDAARAKSIGFVTAWAGTTPRLDRWARSGVVFDKAFSTSPWSLPSHASMLSGRYAGELRADWTVPAGADYPVLPELLRDRGYLTGAFVANLHYAAWDSGLQRGFLHYDDYQANWPQIVRSSSYMQTNLADTLLRAATLSALRSALAPDLSIVPQHRYRSRLGGEVIDAFLSWEARRGERPYFAFLNLMDPHLVTSAPDETRRRYPPDARGESDYLASMRYLDTEVDRLLNTLAERRELDRTLVIITADHGELLGEHGLEGHARSAYRTVLHVPLLVRFPKGVSAGARVHRAVSLRDLAATIQDLTAVQSVRLPGVSLAVLWRDSSAVPSPAVAEVKQQPNPLGDYPTAHGDLSALFDEEWYYIKNHGTGLEELYHYATDTAETVNYATARQEAPRLIWWRSRLQQILIQRQSLNGADGGTSQ